MKAIRGWGGGGGGGGGALQEKPFNIGLCTDISNRVVHSYYRSLQCNTISNDFDLHFRLTGHKTPATD